MIHLATDHAGFAHKEAIKAYLLGKGFEVIDHGAKTLQIDDDYPDFIHPAAEAVAKDTEAKAIIFGYSGEGEAMVANRVKGVRAAVYNGGQNDILILSREHNNANILSIGAFFVSIEQSIETIELWLGTSFTNEERHIRRLSKF